MRPEATRWLINILIVACVVAGILNLWLLSQQRGLLLDTNALSQVITTKFNLSREPRTLVMERRALDASDAEAQKPLLNNVVYRMRSFGCSEPFEPDRHVHGSQPRDRD